MYSEQPTNKPRRYLLLVKQPLRFHCYFVDRHGPAWDSEGFSRQLADSIEGHLQFTIQVGGQTYGPYNTTIRTSYGRWQARKSIHPSLEAQQLSAQLGNLRTRLIDAWAGFNQQGPTITAEMVLQKAGLQVFSLAEGGALYVR